jgi:hypothetical protein
MIKKILLGMVFIMLTNFCLAQLTVNVFINGTKAGQYEIKKDQTEGGGLPYKKKDYKKIDKLTLEISGAALGKGYTKKIEVIEDENKVLYTANETLGADGQFILAEKAIYKKLIKGDAVKFYLILNPSNTKSKMPSRKIYMGMLSKSK